MDRQHRRLADEYEPLRDRVADTERQVEQLQNTLCAVAREASSISVTHACSRCQRSYMLVKRGRMYCPECGYHRSV